MVLKLCPYCDPTRPPMIQKTIMTGKAYIACLNCGMEGPKFDEGDYCFQNASDAWNELPRKFFDRFLSEIKFGVNCTPNVEEKEKSDLLKQALKDVPRGTTFSIEEEK